jgi:hypothetical protein
MTSYTISPIWGAGVQLFDNNGNPLVSGKIYTYEAGTTTPAVTYTNPTGSASNTNPIITNASGRLANEIWLPVSGAYKFVLKDANDVLLATYDNIPTIPQPPIVNDASSISYQVGYEVDAGNFTVGETYLITVVGTTNFVAIGAAANATGILFTATGAGSGTGKAEYSRTVQERLRDYASVKDFGAVGDGVADDTVAIQAALNAGGLVYAPQGIYKISAALTVTNDNSGLIGEGPGTLIQTTSTTADIFTLGNGSSEISGLLFQNFAVWSTVVKTGGYAFNCRFTTDSQWQNVNVGNQELYNAAAGHRLYYGWYFDRFGTVGVFGGWCITPQDGIRMRGNADDSFSAELVVDGNIRFLRQNAVGACGIRIAGNCGGIYLRRADVSLADTGVIIDTSLSLASTTATKRNREIFIQGFNVDSCASWGLKQVAESVALLIMDTPWAASNGPADGSAGGILLEGGSTVVPIVSMGNPQIYNNKGAGLRVEGGFVTVDGGFVILNGRSANGGHGVEFGTTFPVRFSMVGSDVALNGTASKGIGLQLKAGMDNFCVEGASFYANAQAQIDNPAGFGPTKIIRGNLGYVTENSNVATITNGNSSIVVSHGLNATPETVLISPIGTPSVGTYSVGPIGSTTFTIENGATAVGTRQFSWRASVTGG